MLQFAIMAGLMAGVKIDRPENRGRKSIYTRELHEAFVKCIAISYYVSTACDYVGMSELTYNDWKTATNKHIKSKHRDGSACDQYCDEFTVAKRSLVEDVKKAQADFNIENMTELKRHGKKNWLPLAWMQERTQPDKFGMINRVITEHKGTVKHKHTHELLSVESRQKILLAGQKSLELESAPDDVIDSEIVQEQSED